jgi:precorrin-6B methylase 2
VHKPWTGEALHELARAYQRTCALLAAAELDVFGMLAAKPLDAAQLAAAVGGDLRATRTLADALVVLGFLDKKNGAYELRPGIAAALTEQGAESILPMVRHQANCMRSWVELARVVRTGRPAERPASIRGNDADRAAFIEAMHVSSRDAAPKVVATLAPHSFSHLLDVGGGPGTWTIAFLRAAPRARATLFDLPATIPIARRHIEAAGLSDRVRYVAGDFSADALPSGADLAWVSAIVHQNSRAENRELFRNVHGALVPGGQVLIRDIVMDEAHTSPPAGAMFAAHMLVITAGGGTYSLAELSEDLEHAGFCDPSLVSRGERDMDCVVRARKG